MKDVNYELYKIFYYAGLHKNLTRVSEILFVSQPAISQSIKKLEQELGYKLIFKIKGGIALTEEGNNLFEYIKKPILKLENVINNINSKKQTKIIIASGLYLNNDVVLPAIELFNKKYPNINFQLITNIYHTNIPSLKENIMDLIVLRSEVIKDENIIMEKIYEEEYGFYGTDKYKSMSSPIIIQTEQSSIGKHVRKLFPNIKPAFNLEGYASVITFTKVGLGIGFIEKRHVKNTNLHKIQCNKHIEKKSVCIAYNKNKVNNVYLMDLINYIKEIAKHL